MKPTCLYLVIFCILTISQVGSAKPPEKQSFLKILQSGHYSFFVNKYAPMYATLADGSGTHCLLSLGTAITLIGPVPDGATLVKASVYASPQIGDSSDACLADSIVTLSLPDILNMYNEVAKYYGNEEAY